MNDNSILLVRAAACRRNVPLLHQPMLFNTEVGYGGETHFTMQNPQHDAL